MLETSLGHAFRTCMEVMGVKDVLDVDVCLSDLLCGASRTEESDTCCIEALREFDQPRFVIDR
jgi:hypothetical protein